MSRRAAMRLSAALCAMLMCVEAVMAQPNGPAINQEPGGALPFGQQGGITAGTVNIGPQRRVLADESFVEMRNQLLALPRDRKISFIATMGDTETIEFRNQITEFMRSNGFKFDDRDIAHAVWSKPFHGVKLVDRPDGSIQLQIGPP